MDVNNATVLVMDVTLANFVIPVVKVFVILVKVVMVVSLVIVDVKVVIFV